mmetsp:Transcript_58596/g.85880  ORF Transcript_58596/g.85880 Transcript_58596/m.85880 type:complete len:260 (+) Transcript_58596:408-1187(+)
MPMAFAATLGLQLLFARPYKHGTSTGIEGKERVDKTSKAHDLLHLGLQLSVASVLLLRAFRHHFERLRESHHLRRQLAHLSVAFGLFLEKRADAHVALLTHSAARALSHGHITITAVPVVLAPISVIASPTLLVLQITKLLLKITPLPLAAEQLAVETRHILAQAAHLVRVVVGILAELAHRTHLEVVYLVLELSAAILRLREAILRLAQSHLGIAVSARRAVARPRGAACKGASGTEALVIEVVLKAIDVEPLFIDLL